MSTAPSSEKRLNKNIIANIVGQSVSACLAMIFVPVYVDILGIESYGLIGFFALLQMLLTILEMGVYPVLGRHFARFTSHEVTAERVRDIFKSYLVLSVVVGLILVGVIAAVSNLAASDWLNPTDLSLNTVSECIQMMGIILGLRFVRVVFRSALLGLQFQVSYNVILLINSTLRYVGVIAFLLSYEASVTAFFVWQLMVEILGLIAFGVLCYCRIPSSSRRSRFSLSCIMDTRAFAAGTILITLLSVGMRQIDKLYLSKMISLDDFGYYMLAFVVASIPLLMVSPLYQAFYPRFVELFAAGVESNTRRSYLRATMYTGIIAATIGVPMMILPDRLILVWSGDEVLATNVGVYLRWMALGGVLEAILYIPYCAQIAYGWTRLAVVMRALSLVLCLGFIFLMVPIYGALAAAWSWAGVNLLLICLWIPLMNRRILRGTGGYWYVLSVFVPCSVAVAGCLLVRFFVPEFDSRGIEFLVMSGCVLMVFGAVSGVTFLANRSFGALLDRTVTSA